MLVLLLSLKSQTVVFQLFDFQLREFKKFIIKKVLLPKSRAIIGAKFSGSRIKRYTVGISNNFHSHTILLRNI